MYRRIFALFLILAIAIVPAGCDEKREVSEKKFKIGFSQCTGDSKWRQATLEGVNRELSFHPGAELIYKNAGDNSALQIQQIKAMMNEGIDALLVSPNEAEPLTGIVEEIYRRGIPVVVIDRRILSDQYTAFVGTDNYQIGYMAGKYIGSIYKPGANIIEITGLKGSTSSAERRKGFKSAMLEIPQMKPSRHLEGDWLRETAYNQFWNIRDELRAGDIIFAQNDPMALGAYDVYKKLGLDQSTVFIGTDGLGGSEGGIESVADRKLKATLLNPTGGEEAVQIVFKILNKQPFKKENTLSTVVIDSTNVRIMKLQTEKISSQQRDILNQSEVLLRQQRILQNQTLVIRFFIVALLLVITLALVAAIALKNNRKINRRLSVQNKEILDQKNQLEEMADRVRQSSEARSHFFTNISHEFRTPLTLILGPLNDILATEKLSSTSKHSLLIVHRNARRLLRLINQLMDFRKVEERKMKLAVSENDLISFVQEIADAFQVIAKQKSISFFVSTSHEKLPLWFDVNMLDKVLFNLLSNAFKFTPDHGVIHITVEKETDQQFVVIRVEDSGIGMTPDEIQHAFDLFYRGNTSDLKGTGLGLSLSKELVALHFGTINVKSKKWEGSCFEIHLRTGNSHFNHSEVTPSVGYSPTHSEVADLLELQIDSQIPPQQRPSEASREHSVLIIEDNPDLRAFLKSRLSRNYEVHEADNGNTGLAMAYQIIPDLIISDIMIPGKNGFEVTKIIKRDLRTSHIPLVLLTAKNSMEEQIQGIKMQADAFITKPFDAEYLSETIGNLLKSRELLKEHYTSELPAKVKTHHPANRADKKFISDFTAIIESNIANERFTIDGICKEMGISRVQLYRKIKSLLGYNVNDYILSIRLKKAKFLLSNEELSILDISGRVGFSSQAYFSTVFRSKFSMTPTEYRDGLTKQSRPG